MTVLGIVNPLLFMLTMFLLDVTPRPGMAYIVGCSVSQGRAAGLLSLLGVSMGCYVYVLAAALGPTALLAMSTVAFVIIRMVGVAYLTYLDGCMLLVSSERDDATIEQAEAPAARRARPFKSLFMQGLLTNVLNLKVVPFFLPFFSQLVDLLVVHKALTFLALGVMSIVMSTIWNGLMA